MGREKEYSFSTSHLVPIGFFLAASLFMDVYPAKCPLTLQVSAFFLFSFSCLWGFKGLFFSSLLSSGMLFVISPEVFQEFPSFLFFLISFNTAVVIALFKKSALEEKKGQEIEMTSLKAWESHYYAFREKCLEEVEELKSFQEGVMYTDLEMQSLKHERLEEFLKEDESQTSLMKLLTASQEKCHYLEKEIEILEELLALSETSVEKTKTPRRKKIKEDGIQSMLF